MYGHTQIFFQRLISGASRLTRFAAYLLDFVVFYVIIGRLLLFSAFLMLGFSVAALVIGFGICAPGFSGIDVLHAALVFIAAYADFLFGHFPTFTAGTCFIQSMEKMSLPPDFQRFMLGLYTEVSKFESACTCCFRKHEDTKCDKLFARFIFSIYVEVLEYEGDCACCFRKHDGMKCDKPFVRFKPGSHTDAELLFCMESQSGLSTWYFSQSMEKVSVLCGLQSRARGEFFNQSMENVNLADWRSESHPWRAFQSMHGEDESANVPAELHFRMQFQPEPAARWFSVDGPRERARYGFRGTRVGEASHPGPARIAVQRSNGMEAALSLIERSGDFAWQLTTAPRLHGAYRATPKLALQEWLSKHRGDLTAGAAAEVARWEPDPEDVAMSGVPSNTIEQYF